MFCTKCGNQIKDGFKFCPKCGTPVYIEKEKVESEAKAQEEEVKKETPKKEPEAKKDEKVKVTTESISITSSKKPSEPFTLKQNDRSNTLIAKILDNEHLKKKAEQEIEIQLKKIKVDSLLKVNVDIKDDKEEDKKKQDQIPNSLIADELNIEGVMKMAKLGDKDAMLRQAFRYEMGIGVDKNITKAEELYKNVGGIQSLSLLERSHINSIIPNPLFDSALLSTDETNEDKNNVLRVIPFVKDVILDYSNKVERDKLQGRLSKDNSIDYRNEFIQRMKKVRNLYPELLLANLNETLTEDDFIILLNSIKENVSSRYRLNYIPSLYTFIDYVDGNEIAIPSSYEMNSNGFFNIRYKNDNEKIKLMNQFILTLLLQLQIKKIRIIFVDLQSRYEYKNLLRQLNPLIYEEKPITSEEKFEELIKRLEDWKLEVMKKYDDYPAFCEKNQEIPIPYEFIFFLDNSIVNKYEDRLMNLYLSSHNIGVYFVLFNKIAESIIKEENIDSRNRAEIYLTSNSFYRQLYLNGIVFMSIVENVNLYKKNKNEDVFYITNRILDFNLREAKDYRNNPVQGYGNYEVVLKVKRYPELNNYDIESLKPFTDRFSNYSKKNKKDIVQTMLKEEGFLLKVFPTEVECKNYVNNEIIPNISYINENRMRLIPYFVKKQNVDQIGIALYIPQNLLLFRSIEQDLRFYFSKIGLSTVIINQLIDMLFGRIGVGSISIGNGMSKPFPDPKATISCPSIVGEIICRIRSEKYDGFFFPDFFNNKYTMDFGFRGFNKDNCNDLNIAYEAINKCKIDISIIEKELDKFAIQEWGKGYAKEHLSFIDIIEDVAYYEIRKKKRHRIPILQINQFSPDSLIKPINIADDDHFFQVCINYINREAEAKEEAKVVPLTYDDSNMSYEDITSELLIDVGKKGKNDVSFCMDLVSHVHSFIIGQSGSGKSVFLHNIIGGAMLKYAPEDLQLYLLDFKLGGVEFNRYQGAKHVKALLVDNSDPQVTLEILRELRNSMTERGKLLRSAGVNNIGEYNKMHQQDRMPHVLVVADECHEMFKADDSIPRQVRNEISDIVIKIAKEGRSQGVHLVFATQTLSGTEISSEIINNVSDFYLLKCAQTDSERLVPNSSNITSELSTGQIYYHHVDEQVKFQAYYTDKEAAEKLMAAIVEKAKDHKSNGEFYFNGAQMFYLDEAVKEQIQDVKGKSPVAFLGKAIDISQKDLYIKLNEDFSENVLLLGLNDQEQVTRTTLNLFVSLMMSAKLKHKDIAFKVIDCLNNEEGDVHELIFDLENEGLCEIIERRQRSKFFKDLAQGVLDGTAEETVLLILGQDRFRELKMDMELEDDDNNFSDNDAMSISNQLFGGGGSTPSNVRTYKDALSVIVDKGPDYGVHTLLQIEKVSNLLYMDLSPKEIFQKFKHLVLLKSPENEGHKLYLNDDIHLEKLSSDWERLRAYYYAEESDSYTLFTPYMPSKSKEIINLLKTI